MIETCLELNKEGVVIIWRQAVTYYGVLFEVALEGVTTQQ